MRILIAPDKFKDALDASAVAAALADGARDAVPQADITCCPLGDGGEGTGQILAAPHHAEVRETKVLDPLGRARRADWWLSSADRTAIIEMAAASGLALLAPPERSALRTTSFGTGQLIAAAAAAGCAQLVLCVGGSATVDGGAGCLQALGWQLIDSAGAPLSKPATGGDLRHIRSVQPPHNASVMPIQILCDVDNPLLGPRGAAAVFAPQKGATPDEVRELEAGLQNWVSVLARDCGVKVRDVPGGGAAGGLPAGLAGTLRARLVPGFDVVAESMHLPAQLAACDLCLTGEGRIDAQTAGGKVVAGVARLARVAGAPVIAFTGVVQCQPGQSVDELAAALGVQTIVCITPADAPLAAALAATATNLRAAARRELLRWSAV